MTKPSRSLLSRLSKELSQDFKLPLFLAIIFEIISFFQVFAIIIKSTFPNESDSIELITFLKKIFLFPSIFGLWDATTSQDTSEFLWIIFGIYVTGFTILLVIAAIMVYKEVLNSKLYKLMTIFCLIHTRTLYLPIHYFFLQSIHYYRYQTASDTSPWFALGGILGITVIWEIFSFAVGFLKEFYFYRINKTRNSYCSKNNTTSKVLFLYKAVVPLILLLTQASKGSAIAIAVISILTSILLIHTIYTKLPFYDITLLRCSYILASIMASFSILGLFNSLVSSTRIMETILIVMTALLARATNLTMEQLFERIIGGDIPTAEMAIHYPILLKKYTSKYTGLILVRNSFPLESIYFYSTFEPKLEDPTKPKDKKMTKIRNQEFYSKIMEKFLASRAYQKKSEVLLLYMSRIFMKKLEDASRALALIDKVKTFDVSIPIRNSIDSLQVTLQESYIKAFSYSEDELELSNYFAYREEFNSLKENMQAEITKHLQFWQELMLDDVNVKKTVDLADGIDSIYLKIRDRWRKNSDKFSSVYPSSLLMYGLYLDTIRGLPQESMQVIQKFYNYNKNQNYNKSLISETSAIIIASLEKDKLGIVIDASNTVESLFKTSKENLIGEKVNILMPGFIAKNHDWWMQRYLQSSMVTGVDRQIHSYAKAGDALMGIEVNLKLYPYLDKGVNIMAYLKMKTQEDHSFIVKPDGTVAECPPKLTETLGNFGLNLKNVNLLDVCPKFPKVNTAFNLVYGSAETKLKTQEDQETAMNNKNELDDALRTKEDFPLETQMHTYNYTHMDTQGDQGNVPLRTKNEEVPLIVLNEFNRSEAMKRSNTLSSPLLRHPSQYVDLKTLPIHKQHTYVSENEAKDICDVFKGNSVLRFQNFAPKFAVKREDITIEVTIEPYVIEGEVYKIVKVFDVQIASQQDLDVSMDPIIQMSPFVSKGSQLEQFVSYKSKSMSHQTPSEFSIPDEKDEEIPKAKEQPIANSKTLKPRLSQMKESDTKDERQKKIDSLGLNHHKEEMDNLDIRQSLGKGASSTKSYSHMDYKLIKTLHDFFGERKVRMMTRVSIYSVYLIMAGILALAFINFIFTQKSLTEIDNGVNIVNVSSQRLTASLTAWQWMLLLYSRLLGLRPISSLAGLLQTNMVSASQQMETLNNQLRADLNTIGSTEIINEIFSTKTRFYDPVTKLTLTNGTLDIFTAVNVLALDYTAVGVSTANDSVLVTMSEPLTAINNTANDFLVSSETQNEQIIAGLQKIINQNISLLETILGCENFALVLLAISLIAVMRVVIKSYARTFMALVRITPESINERVYRIKKFQTSLDENIEAKSFVENLNLYLNFFEEARDKKFLKNKEKRLKFFSKRYSIRSLVFYMLQFLLISILFILIISGLFVTLFVESLHSFSLLSGINDQLSVTNKLSYESTLVLSTFYFYIMFQNDTTMLIRNEAPAIQLQENLDTLSNANNELLSTLFTGGNTDPVIEQFLQNNICGYLSTSIQSTCLNSTQNNSLGLLSFNSKYYTISKQYVDVYQADTSLTNTKAVVQGYFNDVTLDISVMNEAYSFLTSYIMGNFDSEVSSLQDLNLFLSLGAVLFIVLATILIQSITIKKFIILDNSQKKIYRTLTYNVFSQNKSVGFLLKKEFGGQIEGLNRILYV